MSTFGIIYIALFIVLSLASMPVMGWYFNRNAEEGK